MFILGTANFGNIYQGSTRVLNTHNARDLVQNFISLGGQQLDTAENYGDAKKIIQKLTSLKFTVATKIDSKILLHKEEIISYVQSLKKLYGNKLNCILLHDLLFLNEVKKDSIKVFEDYLYEHNIKLGISIYHKHELDQALRQFKKISLVQAPLNYLDRRFVSDNFLNICNINQITIIYRSIFLQGKLLQEYSYLHPFFKNFSEIESYYADFSTSPFSSLLEFNIEFVKSITDFSKVTIGVETISQLKEIYSIVKGTEAAKDKYTYREINFNEILCIPMNWNMR